ncbi:unnamed protein product [Effrenium voratum]|uniref:Uncharacterized protein n=1 Tax=Effrenium voratum TaxID=2562239 RepID=A0AA36HRN2_9DINO|nr:unnamed protein product [Effrenium voratum]CAJ1420070.1 unnamed protein product [Effrenium voratum]
MGQTASCCEEEHVDAPKEVVLHKFNEPEAEDTDENPPRNVKDITVEIKKEVAADVAEAPDEVGHRLQKPMSGSSRLEKMEQLAVDHEIVRGIPLRESLKNWGRLWRWSPLDLAEEDRKSLWNRSKKVEGYDIFLSHTWLTKGRWKVLTLLLRSGWYMMLLGWVLFAALAMILCSYEVLPMSSSWLVELDGWTGHCTMGYWIWILSITGAFLGLFLSVYLPERIFKSSVCFLDVVSIHQTDSALMERGIYGLGGFLKVAKELRVLWSPPYLSRLWCVFELAAYRTANPKGKIVLNPLFIDSVCTIMFFGSLLGSLLLQYTMLRKMNATVKNSAYSFGTLPLLVAIHVLRREVKLRHLLATGLRDFDLNDAECRNDFDREFIYAGIIQWYGSKEAFTKYVRGTLRRELLGCTYLQLKMPPQYLLMICLGPVCNALESTLALLMADCPTDIILRFIVGRVLATDLCWQLMCLKVALNLCDTLGAQTWPGVLNFVNSFIIFVIYCFCNLVGATIGSIAWEAGLWQSFLWLGGNVLLILLLIGFAKMIEKKNMCHLEKENQDNSEATPM